MCIPEHFVYTYKGMHVNAPARETVVPTVLMAWLLCFTSCCSLLTCRSNSCICPNIPPHRSFSSSRWLYSVH